MKARWEHCTPAWVQVHPSSCGPAIRRPVIEWCESPAEPMLHVSDVRHAHVVGHEHLVDVRTGLPIEHVDRRPA